ncbi:Protein phosphatase 1 regulatory subunit 3C [Yarrowia sp. C11]|nr:Protein phosphatase 1 regulatory subunit 3C [Yarrowia sp. E02]KAG5372931.1 Protein phosphatase 1 regulatory subunit 3C [Yarrowia sp. C11]
MPYIPPGRQRSSSLPFLQAIPRWLSMDEAEEREHQETENTRENARSFGFFRRVKRIRNLWNKNKSKSCSTSWPKAGHAAQTKTRFGQAQELVARKVCLSKDGIDTAEQKTQNHPLNPNSHSYFPSISSCSPLAKDDTTLASSFDTHLRPVNDMVALTSTTISGEPASQLHTTTVTSPPAPGRDTDTDVVERGVAAININGAAAADEVDPLDTGIGLAKSPSSSSLSSLSSLSSMASLSSLTNGMGPISTTLSQLRKPASTATSTSTSTTTSNNTQHTNEKVSANKTITSASKTTITAPALAKDGPIVFDSSALSDSDSEAIRPPSASASVSAASRRAERPSLTRTTSSPGLEKRDFEPAIDQAQETPAPDSPEAESMVLTRAGSSEDVPSTVFSCPPSLTSPERRSSILTQLQMPVSPSIIRKKSGELVKSSLKLSSLVRNKSMPESSMKSAAAQAIKNVHFDQKLEHVRHFLNSDRPQAVADGSVKPRPHHHNHNGVGTFQWHDDESSSDEDDLRKGYDKYIARTEWSLSTPNFPAVPGPKPHSNEPDPMVYLENLFLSADKNNLVGHVAVKNIAFEKQVNVRYSLDYWQTVSQVDATYNDDVRKKLKDMGYDRFTFSINMNLLPQHILTQKPMHLCVRYTANGTEYWDNNGFANFQLDFKRVPKPQRGPGRFHNRSKTEYGVGWTPKYSKSSSPEKNENAKPGKDQEPRENSNESFLSDFEYKVASPKAFSANRRSSVDDSIPLKSKTKSKFLTPQRRNTDDQHNPNLFSRYDFGNSFRQKTPERPSAKAANSRPKVRAEPVSKMSFVSSSSGSSDESSQDSSTQSSSSSSPPTTAGTGVDGAGDMESAGLKKAPSIGNLAAVMTGGVKPAVDSASYQEMINKYCFFGSAPKTDEPEDYFVPGHGHSGSISSTSSTSSEDSILGMRPQQPTYVQSKISSFSSALSSAWPWNGNGNGSGASSTATTPTGGEYVGPATLDGSLRSPTPTLGSSPTGSCLESSSPVGWAKGVEV